MKTKIIITLLLVLVGILIVGCNVERPCDPGPCVTENETNSTDSLIAPIQVLDKYEELNIQYKNSIGVFLRKCTKDNELIFVVDGSGGFSGISYYYDKEGNDLGNYIWDDIIEPNEPKAPVDLEGFVCQDLKVMEGIPEPFFDKLNVEVSSLKKVYMPEEEIYIKFKNNENVPVYIFSKQCERLLWYVERSNGEILELTDPLGVRTMDCPMSSKKIYPGEEFLMSQEHFPIWDKKYYADKSRGRIQAEPGIYKIVFPRVYVGDLSEKYSKEGGLNFDIDQSEMYKLEVEVQLIERDLPLRCSSNSDCECNRFDGVDFQPGTSEGNCNLETNTCGPCTYF